MLSSQNRIVPSARPARRRIAAVILAAFAAVVLAHGALADIEGGIKAYRAGDYALAFAAFKEEAVKGDRRAQYNLGVMYHTGRGVTRDLDQAIQWYRRAADQGLPAAQHGLGLAHYRGEGAPQDYAEAARWFRKAADQGMAEAQYNLGVMYFNGQGVEENMAEVVKWISLAAGKGFADAQYRLGIMYEEGNGLPSDRAEAAKWFQRAADAGHEAAAARGRALAARRAADESEAAGQPGSGAVKAEPETAAPPGKSTAAVPATELAGDGAPAAAPATTGRPAPADPPAAKPPAPPPAQSAARGPAAALPAPPIAPPGGWRVQFASFRSPSEAMESWHRLKSRHAAALEAMAPIVERADLGPRGIYHRLQTGPLADREAARGLCAAIARAAPAQSCLVVAPKRR